MVQHHGGFANGYTGTGATLRSAHAEVWKQLLVKYDAAAALWVRDLLG